MTLGTTINSIVDDGNGVTTAFAFPFLVPAASDLVVVYVSPTDQPAVLLQLSLGTFDGDALLMGSGSAAPRASEPAAAAGAPEPAASASLPEVSSLSSFLLMSSGSAALRVQSLQLLLGPPPSLQQAPPSLR